MGKDNKTILAYSGNDISALFMQGELEKNGISSLIKNNFVSGTLAGFSGGFPSTVDLYIQETDLPEATPIIEEIIKDMESQ